MTTSDDHVDLPGLWAEVAGHPAPPELDGFDRWPLDEQFVRATVAKVVAIAPPEDQADRFLVSMMVALEVDVSMGVDAPPESWVSTVCRLRASGVSVPTMRRYLAALGEDAETYGTPGVDVRRELFEQWAYLVRLDAVALFDQVWRACGHGAPVSEPEPAWLQGIRDPYQAAWVLRGSGDPFSAAASVLLVELVEGLARTHERSGELRARWSTANYLSEMFGLYADALRDLVVLGSASEEEGLASLPTSTDLEELQARLEPHHRLLADLAREPFLSDPLDPPPPLA